MIDATIWKLTDNPLQEPFYLRRDFDEDNLDRFIENGDEDEFTQYIYTQMKWFARLYVDEVAPNAPFQFVVPDGPEKYHMKFLKEVFVIDTPSGPIQCEMYVNRLSWFLAACAVVKVMDD